ncbi:hypothetical protein [Mycobacterium sp.]|uniref:hypothetical protein n=1 Tax=Mycobacterium sp. TaxID=1785 RepID=UPI003A871088
MSGVHPDLGAELRQLAQVILDGLDPSLRAAAAVASGAGAGKCQQVWCPVCALAAVVNGEQHPLVNVIADHSVALMELIRAMVDDTGTAATQPPRDEPAEAGSDADAAGGNAGEDSGAGANGSLRATVGARYQAIPVKLQA